MPGRMGKLSGNGEEDGHVRMLRYAVIAAIAFGLLTAGVIIWYAGNESYSALHIDAYSNYIENGTVTFTYGVDRFGPAPASYSIKALHRGKVMYSRDFTMNPGSMNATVSFRLNEAVFPVKLQVVLTESAESGGSAYEVYFWLKGNR
jgi:hypothetical protein